ncbi:MAG: D-alanyl-D-alanine carboxypeptidase [Hyphomicrobiaceae bacterium]
MKLSTMLLLSLLAGLLAGTEGARAGRSAALVVDANSGRVLFAEDADALRFPASLTKVMTLYLVFDEIRKGRLSYASKIRISAHAASQPPSNLDLEEGDTLTVADAVKALVTKSANDVAAALAEHLAGSVEKFAGRMTSKAREIGMTRTVFRNASGLPDREQVTTARDMVTLGLRLQDDFPEDYKLFQTERFTYAGRSHANHNTLLRTYEGIDGIKTGYTRASGFNLLSSARRGGRHIVAVVFGGATAGLRNQRMRYLIASAMRRASTRRTRALPPRLIARPRPAGRPARVAAAPPRPPAPPARPATQPPKPVVSHPTAPAPAQRATAASLPPQHSAAPAAAATSTNPPAPAIAVARVRSHSVVTGPGASARAEPAGGVPAGRLAFAAPSMAAGVRMPSTLGAQAAALAGGQEPAAGAGIRPATPMPLPSALGGPPAGTVAIQVGAYATRPEAERALNAVRGMAGGLLDHASAFAVPVGGGKPLVRARFGGFDAASAASTCLELRRKSIDCFVAR